MNTSLFRLGYPFILGKFVKLPLREKAGAHIFCIINNLTHLEIYDVSLVMYRVPVSCVLRRGFPIQHPATVSSGYSSLPLALTLAQIQLNQRNAC